MTDMQCFSLAVRGAGVMRAPLPFSNSSHPSPPNAPCNNQWRRMKGWLGKKNERQIDLQCQVENEVVTKQCGGEEAREREEERGLDLSYFHLWSVKWILSSSNGE